MKMPPKIQEAMQMQVEAERKKRATVLCLQSSLSLAHWPSCRSWSRRASGSRRSTLPTGRSRFASPLVPLGAASGCLDCQAQILASEAAQQSAINEATGAAASLQLRAAARAGAIEKVSVALAKEGNSGASAASLAVAEQYVAAFANLAKASNTLILPAAPADASSMVAQVRTEDPTRSLLPLPTAGPSTRPCPSTSSSTTRRRRQSPLKLATRRVDS